MTRTGLTDAEVQAACARIDARQQQAQFRESLSVALGLTALVIVGLAMGVGIAIGLCALSHYVPGWMR